MFVHSKIQKFLNLSSMLNIRCPRLPALQIACKLFAIHDKIFASILLRKKFYVIFWPKISIKGTYFNLQIGQNVLIFVHFCALIIRTMPVPPL